MSHCRVAALESIENFLHASYIPKRSVAAKAQSARAKNIPLTEEDVEEAYVKRKVHSMCVNVACLVLTSHVASLHCHSIGLHMLARYRHKGCQFEKFLSTLPRSSDKEREANIQSQTGQAPMQARTQDIAS